MTTQRWKVGDRVYAVPSTEWTKGAQESLTGMQGTVEKVRESALDSRVFLVKFDARPKPWHANQQPSHSWWFSAGELKPL